MIVPKTPPPPTDLVDAKLAEGRESMSQTISDSYGRGYADGYSDGMNAGTMQMQRQAADLDASEQEKPDADEATDAMGIGLSHDLGGGASMVAGFGQVGDVNQASAGLSFKF